MARRIAGSRRRPDRRRSGLLPRTAASRRPATADGEVAAAPFGAWPAEDQAADASAATTWRLRRASRRAGRSDHRRGAAARRAGGRCGRPSPTPRGCGRCCGWAPSRGLQLRSGSADGGAEGSGRGSEDGGGLVVGRAFDGGDARGPSVRARTGRHGGADVEPAGPDRRVRIETTGAVGWARSRRRSWPEPVRRQAAGRHEQPRQDGSVPVQPVRWSHNRGTPPGRDPRRRSSRWSRRGRTGTRRTNALECVLVRRDRSSRRWPRGSSHPHTRRRRRNARSPVTRMWIGSETPIIAQVGNGG